MLVYLREMTDVEHCDLRAAPDEVLRDVWAFEQMLEAESEPGEPPRPFDSYLAAVRTIPDFIEIEALVVRDESGDVAGEAEGVVLRTPENPHLAQLAISVRPEERRRGIGRLLLSHAVDFATSHNRTLFIGVTNDCVPAGSAFASCIGAQAVQSSHVNRLELAGVDRTLVERWIAEGPARAPGYSLVRLDGRCPDDIVGEVVTLLDVMNDAPSGELELEDQHVTVERLRDTERQMDATGSVRWWIFARHDESGRLVGLTDISWNAASPDTVNQGETGVVADHRGHALGKWMKAAMLSRLLNELPESVDVRSVNADSNAAMLGINSELGFKPYMAKTTWQVSVDRVRAYLRG